MSTAATRTAGRWCAFTAMLTTSAAVVALLMLATPGRWPLVVVLICALLWGLGGAVAVALTPTGCGHGSADDGDSAGAARIGVLMHLGGVPDEVARTASASAAASGPVALVVPPGRAVPELLDPEVFVVQPDDPADGTAEALALLLDRCDAVLFVSARALPASGCREAGSRLVEGASWVIGAAEPLNRDHFGPTSREQLDARLRRQAAAAGLWCWQPDATVVRTSLLRSSPLPPGRPLGSWLRDRSGEGLAGATVEATLSRRAAPVAADGFWPDTTARQRAAAADLSDAMTSARSRWRARAVAAGLLVRALSGWSVVLWLAALVLLAGGSPVRHGEGALAALISTALVLRWLAPHLAGSTRPAPMADMIAGLYALPGSLAATASAWSRRVRPVRRAVPVRPLVWLALVATAAAASVVLTARPGDSVARLAAAVAAALLVLLWVFTVRSLVERSWRRIGFRIPLDLPAVVEREGSSRTDTAWRLVDGSPGGFGVLGPVTGLTRGDEVTVRVPRPGGDELVLDGTVAARRHGRHGAELVGVELRSVAPGAAAWAAVLLDGASEPPATAAPVADERTDTSAWGRRADRLVIGLAVGATVAVVLTLALVLAGLRPLVVRSGSMEPTYSVGDVVLVASEQAGDLRTGQVVTRFDAPEAADSLTHRVQEVSVEGGAVRVVTRGDANDNAEVWTAPAAQQVGVVVASVPVVGLPLTAVRTSTGWALGVGTAVLGVIAVLFRPRRRRTDKNTSDSDTSDSDTSDRDIAANQDASEEESLSSTDNLPTESAHTTFGERS